MCGRVCVRQVGRCKSVRDLGAIFGLGPGECAAIEAKRAAEPPEVWAARAADLKACCRAQGAAEAAAQAPVVAAAVIESNATGRAQGGAPNGGVDLGFASSGAAESQKGARSTEVLAAGSDQGDRPAKKAKVPPRGETHAGKGPPDS